MGTGTVQERMRLLAAAAVLAAAMLSPAACQVLAFALVPAAHNSIAPHSIFSALPQGPPSVAGNANIKDASLSRVGSRGRRTSRAAGVAAFDNDSSDSFGGKRQRFDMLQLSMSTSAVEVNEEGDAPATTSVEDEFDVKADLLNQIDLGTSSKKRTAVNELMLKLEPMNPTLSPARSPILNGVWEFLYTGGLSPGILAVQVLSRVAKTFPAVVDLKGVTLTVKRDQPRVEAAVKGTVFGAEAQIKVRTRLEQLSDMRLQEVYEEAEVAGIKIPIPTRIQPRRTLFITYLDDDIMIARDNTGAPDLLIRKEKEFRFNTGTPSTSEDDASPGSG